MLTEKQIKEIKEHLDKAQNPVFFFDNDEDGLCSYVILRKYCEKGKGVAIKSFPELSFDYFKKAQELDADYIFILDKPLVSKEFLEEAHKYNLPIVWIDHHPTDEKIPEFVNYYNPLLNEDKSNEPVTALCYQISKRKEDLWVLIAGSMGDKFIPKEYDLFKEQYPELSVDSENPWDIYYKSEIGKIARMMSFGLKDTVSNVVSMVKFLVGAKNPHEVLEENNKNKQLHKRFGDLEKKYEKLIKESEEQSKKYKKLVLFEYSGETAISSDLSNRLMYLFPEKMIFVMRTKGSEVKISGRGPKVKETFLKVIEGIKDSRGGGHDVAIGGQIPLDSLEEFKEKLVEITE